MNLIKYYRKKRGYTQEELARKLNISLRHMQRIEKGECIPNVQLAIKMSEILKTEVKVLF